MRLGLGLGIPYSLGGPEAAAFSPLDLSPLLWLDASDTSTITESGGAVSQWDDKSGNGNDFVQATAANQPTTGASTFNSLNVLDFSSDFVTGAVTFAGTTGWVFMITSWSGAQRNSPYGGTNTGTPALLQQSSGSASWNSEPTTVTTYSLGASSTGDLIAVQHGSSTQLRKNGVVLAESGGPQGSIAGLAINSIGKLGRALVYHFGFIAEVIIVDGTLTAGEISDTESYLANKWGITL